MIAKRSIPFVDSVTHRHDRASTRHPKSKIPIPATCRKFQPSAFQVLAFPLPLIQNQKFNIPLRPSPNACSS